MAPKIRIQILGSLYAFAKFLYAFSLQFMKYSMIWNMFGKNVHFLEHDLFTTKYDSYNLQLYVKIVYSIIAVSGNNN